MRVAKDTVVTIAYTARLANGEIVDSTEACGPVTYLHGNEQIFPALEETVDGLEAGASGTLELPPAQGYGERRAELVRRIPRVQLPSDLPLEEGRQYNLRARGGEPLAFRLVGIEPEAIVADFNSRAAGHSLIIDVTVVAVRAATAAELRRGTLR